MLNASYILTSTLYRVFFVNVDIIKQFTLAQPRNSYQVSFLDICKMPCLRKEALGIHWAKLQPNLMATQLPDNVLKKSICVFIFIPQVFSVVVNVILILNWFSFVSVFKSLLLN